MVLCYRLISSLPVRMYWLYLFIIIFLSYNHLVLVKLFILFCILHFFLSSLSSSVSLYWCSHFNLPLGCWSARRWTKSSELNYFNSHTSFGFKSCPPSLVLTCSPHSTMQSVSHTCHFKSNDKVLCCLLCGIRLTLLGLFNTWRDFVVLLVLWLATVSTAMTDHMADIATKWATQMVNSSGTRTQ
jgi:hypothetical protein